MALLASMYLNDCWKISKTDGQDCNFQASADNQCLSLFAGALRWCGTPLPGPSHVVCDVLGAPVPKVLNVNGRVEPSNVGVRRLAAAARLHLSSKPLSTAHEGLPQAHTMHAPASAQRTFAGHMHALGPGQASKMGRTCKLRLVTPPRSSPYQCDQRVWLLRQAASGAEAMLAHLAHEQQGCADGEADGAAAKADAGDDVVRVQALHQVDGRVPV